jgi:hypothetical protein
MRKIALLALLVAMTALTGLTSNTVEAGHRYYRGAEDPHAYRYEPRGYYPYYNSGYWKSAREMRLRKRRHYNHPPYYAAWGYPDPYYHHRAWHAYNHGRIRHGHW